MEKDDLWVIFKLAGSMYAINSCCIDGIAREPEQITTVPDTEGYVRGIVKHRGKITTLIDLRQVFELKTTAQEYEEFASVIEKAKTAHKSWVDEFLRCASENCPFHKEKDPHKCEFGVWFDKYEPGVSSVKMRMEKIREPHYKLHKLAYRLEQAAEPSELSSQAKQIETEILKYMDESKEHFKENNRTMMITIRLQNDQSLALIVDEIAGVEQIGEVYEDTSLDKMEHSNLIKGAASTMDGKNLLLLLDEDQIYKMLSESESALARASQSMAV